MMAGCTEQNVSAGQHATKSAEIQISAEISDPADVELAPIISPTIKPSTTLHSSSTPFPSSTPIPTFTMVPTTTPIPNSVYISGVNSFRQSYSISCEARAAVDWADFFGVQIYESDFQFSLPISDNPEKGFVGDVNDPWGQVPPYSYGVHAAPVAKLLKETYNIPAQAAKNFSLENLKKEIANGQPVVAWVIGNMVGGIPAEYMDSEGNTVIVAAYEHAVIITGYGEDHIRYLNNGKFYQVPTDVFLNSWATLENMVIYHFDAGDRY